MTALSMSAIFSDAFQHLFPTEGAMDVLRKKGLAAAGKKVSYFGLAIPTHTTFRSPYPSICIEEDKVPYLISPFLTPNDKVITIWKEFVPFPPHDKACNRLGPEP